LQDQPGDSLGPTDSERDRNGCTLREPEHVDRVVTDRCRHGLEIIHPAIEVS
jgi:hypothetical protein